jgi:Flp pilus assembly protein TadG
MMVTSSIRRFWTEEVGAVAIEFGLVISALVMILTGCFEAGRYILLHQKLDRASTSVADLVAQSNSMSTAILNDLYVAADRQTLPFDLAARGRVIVSSVYKPTVDAAVIQWQCEGGGAYASANSTLGTSGDNATMPSTFAVGLGENIIVAEVFYDYQPFLLTGIFEPSVFRHATFTRPRGTLFTTDPGC